jgi:hypothetical protein
MTSPVRDGSRSPLRSAGAFAADMHGMGRSFNSMMDGQPSRPYSASASSRRGDVGSLVVDDLLQGMNEWRNIQVKGWVTLVCDIHVKS